MTDDISQKADPALTLTLTFKITSPRPADLRRIASHRANINLHLRAVLANRLVRLGIVGANVTVAYPDEAKAKVGPGSNSPSPEPGLPLRQFVRGFLRDHMGLSKIMAHLAADLFMTRWGNRDQVTKKRYAEEDVHTREAIFNRKVIEKADRKFATETKPGALKWLKTRPVASEHPELAHQARQDALAARAKAAQLHFPDRPVYPTRPAHFGPDNPDAPKHTRSWADRRWHED